jgi:hypothetical protein
MAISFIEGTTGTFTNRLAKIGGCIDALYTDSKEGGTYDTLFKALMGRYVGGGITPSGDVQEERDLEKDVGNILDGLKAAHHAAMAQLKTLAQNTAARHVSRDTSKFGGAPGSGTGPGGGGFFYQADNQASPVPVAVSPVTAVQQEIRRQMAAATETVQTCTVACSAAAGSTNTGNGAVVTSVKRGDGLQEELAFAEVGELRCVSDGYQRNGLRNREEFYYYGPSAVDGAHPDWGESGRGSGATTRLRVIDPTAPPSPDGQLLLNAFETASANIFTGWTAVTGTPGADFSSSSAQAYFGSNSLLLLAGTGVNTTFRQYFNGFDVSGSTKSKLEGSTQYGGIVRLRSTGVVTAGAATLALADSGGTTLNDDQAVANITAAIDLTAVAAGAWTTSTFVFRTPKNVAAGTNLRFRVSTAITGANVYVDSLAFAKMIQLYPGGPWLAIFAGQTPFVAGESAAVRDFYTVTTTNDNGGATHARKTFHRLCDALFDLRLHRVLYPSTAGESIADSAIA